MSKVNLGKYEGSIITLEIQSLMPEKFLNLLWRNGIQIKNIKRKDISTFTLEMSLKDYRKIEGLAKKTDSKIKVINRKGLGFFLLKLRRRRALTVGVFLFSAIIYVLSTYIWIIDIETDKTLSPYEVRRELLSYGIKEGIKKDSFNVMSIEEKLIKNNENIMWVRVRVEGAILKVKATERQSPPKIIQEEEPCNLIAKADGEVVRVFTTAGTAVVKKGDIVKRGELLVKGEQGKEGSVYLVHAKGEVIARTFYEEVKKVKISEVKRERTGNKSNNIYIEIGKKKLFLKKSVNNFDKYDKIESRKGPIVFQDFFEVNEKVHSLDKNKLIEETSEELFNNIKINFDKSITIVDKIVDYSEENDTLSVRVLVVAEQNIALPEKIQ
ncbi:sporulation protein YqfD [Clostridium malenominatum]|uniref:Sporulation protein YqfD n=1 Tax=Clostridium malenominatum TaxID=1539 RepID=A0ABN1IR03_9CLOT